MLFSGHTFAGVGEVSWEAVFNTSMPRYQEILNDPSYTERIAAMTYSLVGNYGVNREYVESPRIHVEGFIIRQYRSMPSNWRSEGSLADSLSSTVWASLHNNPARCRGHGVGHCGPQKQEISGPLIAGLLQGAQHLAHCPYE